MAGESGLAARPYTPGAILRWASSRYFSHINVDSRWESQVKQAAEAGVVVHVMRTLSFLDFFCLHVLLKRFGLPLVRFVNDLGLGIFEPFGKGVRRMRLRKQLPEDSALAGVLRGGHSALLFLRRPPRLGKRRRAETRGDLIRTLVETQRRMERPILLQPQTFVWNLRPRQQRTSWVDLFFGPVEWPGAVRRFFQFLFNYRNARLRSGEAFDLQAFVAEHQDLTDSQLADKVRFALLRIIERERRLVVGPTKKTPGRIEEELLRSPRVRAEIEAEAKRGKSNVTSVEKRARKILRRLAANQQPWMIRFLDRFLGWVFRRIYDGIVVDEEGVERIRSAAREGTLIFLPSHKSHVDYLVLSYVLHNAGLVPPLIAAGENLSFFPLGPLLRRGGAFFIRRSFRGRRLYTALVDAYLRKLVTEGFSIEFFLEGGRSRTGKLRPPKLGLLAMVADAAQKAPLKEVSFVPISIGYERIIEEGSYMQELSGGDKKKENVGGLLSTPRILRSQYGRLYVQVGEILPIAELRHALREEPDERKALLLAFGRRINREINRVTAVTPAALVATALLESRRRGIRRAELMTNARQLLEALNRSGGPIADSIR
ncbi:MAG: 1-acyl-sn-glycerol-3-phosphate acyltransferase, partial [Myxococcota bacterium]